MSNRTDLVTVTMTKEEVARAWAFENNLCLIDWKHLQELIECYGEHGSKELVIDAKNCTYILRDKAA
jgi:hypothetical protein